MKNNSSISAAGVGIDHGKHALSLGWRGIATSYAIGLTVSIMLLAPLFLLLTSEAERSLWIARLLSWVGINLYQLVSDQADIDGNVVRLGQWLANQDNWAQAVEMASYVDVVLMTLAVPSLVISVAVGFVIHACGSYIGNFYKSDRVMQGVQDVIEDVDAFNQISRRTARGVELKPSRLGKWLTGLLD